MKNEIRKRKRKSAKGVTDGGGDLTMGHKQQDERCAVVVKERRGKESEEHPNGLFFFI